MKKIFGTLLAGLIVSGCATTATLDKTAHVSTAVRSLAQTFVTMQSRVSRIAYRLATRGVALCSNIGPRNPVELYSAKAAGHGLSAEALSAVYQSYGLDEHVRVLDVLTGAPVITGGLARGDRIISIAGQAIDDNKPVAAERALQHAVAAGKSFDIVVARKRGGHRTVRVAPARGCSGKVVVLATKGAATDVVDYAGDAVGLPADLVHYFRTDDALAFLVGRQIYYLGTSASVGREAAGYAGAALNGALRALTFGVGNALLHPVGNAVALARKARADDADLFALRIMRAGGYDVHDVLKLWQRIDKMPSARRPDNPTLTPSVDRRAAVVKAIKEADVLVSAQAETKIGVQ